MASWHAFRRITKEKKPASKVFSCLPSWPACLAGISMSEWVSLPKARTRFIYSIFFFCTACTQKLFLTNCAAFCCSHASALSLSLTHTHHLLLPLPLSARIVAANAALTHKKNHQHRPAELQGKFFGVFLTAQLHKYALQLTIPAKWQQQHDVGERNFEIADPFWKK